MVRPWCCAFLKWRVNGFLEANDEGLAFFSRSSVSTNDQPSTDWSLMPMRMSPFVTESGYRECGRSLVSSRVSSRF